MNYKNLIDPELKKIASNPPYNRLMICGANFYLRIANKFTAIDEDIDYRTIYINGYKNMKMKMDIFEPAGCKEMLPCLIYFHGGAFSYVASVYHKKLAMIYAKQAHCRVMFPDYHLIPSHPYPAACEDAIETYKYVLTHSEELHVDADKIGVAGDSAGATLAAIVTNLCEEHHFPIPKLQMLVYPLTGVNLQTESMKRFTDTPIWRSTYNDRLWKYYFDNKEFDYTYSPMHMDVPKEFIKTYIETAEYDCLHDDGILYADKLRDNGFDVIINETKKTIHGYDSALDAQVSKQNIEKRVIFLKENFFEIQGLKQKSGILMIRTVSENDEERLVELCTC